MLEFKEFILQAGLTDLNSSGHLFTWWDSSITSPILKKLDRCVVNSSWLSAFNLAHAHFGEKGLSDHCPVNIFMGIPREKIHRPFQFFQHLISAPGFMEAVNNARVCDFTGDPWYVLTSKLKRVKEALRNLNTAQGNLHNAVDIARTALLNFQASMPSQPSPAQFELERKLCTDLQKALLNEEILLKQKSRVHWF